MKLSLFLAVAIAFGSTAAFARHHYRHLNGEWPFPLSSNPIPADNLSGCWNVNYQSQSYELCLNHTSQNTLSVELNNSQHGTVASGILRINGATAQGQLQASDGPWYLELAQLQTSNEDEEQTWVLMSRNQSQESPSLIPLVRR